MKKIAFFISLLLHPLFLPILTFVLIFYANPFIVSNVPHSVQKLMLIMSIIASVFPIFFIVIAHFIGVVKSLSLKDAEDRQIPFIFTSVVYGSISYLLSTNQAIYEYFPLGILIFLSVTTSITLVTMITFFWKISAHSVGICGVFGFLLGISYKYADSTLFYPILLSVFLAGLLMSSRLYLNAHNPEQVFIGAGLGFWISFFSIVFFG